MKRLILCLTLLAGLSLQLIASSPDSTLIPRRVFFAVDEETPSISAEVLYSSLSGFHPLVVVNNEEDAHNLISLETAEGLMHLTLYEGEILVDERTAEFLTSADIPSICSATAEAWSPYLGMTEPDRDETVHVERQEILDEISFNQSITLPNQVNLWLPISARTTMSGDETTFVWLGPFGVDYNWFPSESVGIIASVQLDFGDKLSFARSDQNDNSIPTDYLKILPGVGVLFRSIGRISAEFGLKLSFGAISITPTEDSDSPDLAAGETGWYFYPGLEIFMNINWNINEHWSMKWQMLNMDLSLYNLGMDEMSPYESNDGFLFTFLKLGAAYRW